MRRILLLAIGLMVAVVWWHGTSVGGTTRAPRGTSDPSGSADVASAQASKPGPAQASRTPIQGQAPGATSADDPLLLESIPPGEALALLANCVGQRDGRATGNFERDWSWLDPEAAAIERERHAQARAWLLQRCGPWAELDRGKRLSSLQRAWQTQAIRSQDLLDRLRAISQVDRQVRVDMAEAAAMRALLEEALRSGRPELLREVGRILDNNFTGMPQVLGPYTGRGAYNLFALLGCDLGAPCGSDSEIVLQNCALTGRCGYPDFETLVFDALVGTRGAERIREHRARLLRRIRSGDISGLFDPVPLPPG